MTTQDHRERDRWQPTPAESAAMDAAAAEVAKTLLPLSTE
jgi:hypothetical protein